MENKRIMHLALAICNIVLGFLFLLGAIILLVIIHWHIDPGFYETVIVKDAFESGFGTGNFQYCGDCPVSKDALKLSDLTALMIYWVGMRMLFFITLTILILLRVKQILQAVKDVQTFYDKNIKHFETLAKYGIILFLVSSFNFIYIENIQKMHFSVAFGPLLFTIGLR